MSNQLWVHALCAFILSCGCITANENILAPLGDRQTEQPLDSKGLAQYLEATESGIVGPEKNNAEPSEEMLAASKECQANGGGNDRKESQDKLDQKSGYITTHPDAFHYVIAVTLPYGTPVQIEDGSIWSIYSGDSYKTLNWLSTDNVFILPNRNPIYKERFPYCLFNEQTGVFVQTTCTCAPFVNSTYSHWVYAIDYYNCQLVLNDGSIWNIPFSDSWFLDAFLPGDYVAVGLNDTPHNGLGANILINFNTLEYVYSTCIFY